LIHRVVSDEYRSDHALDVTDRGEDALAEVATLAVRALGQGLDGGRAVAELVRFVFAGRGARRYGGAAERAGGEADIDLDGRVASGINDLASGDGGDGGLAQGEKVGRTIQDTKTRKSARASRGRKAESRPTLPPRRSVQWVKQSATSWR
jgi:hypothetical protein